MSSKFREIKNTINFITTHPYNRDRKIKALSRWIEWQLKSRLWSQKSFVHNYVDNTKVYVRRGMTGVTGNIYCGLHEWCEMCFTLHFLRPSDSFVDVGANVGTYTMLASGAVGAFTYAFEPIPRTFKELCSNVKLNDLWNRVEVYNTGLSDHRGKLLFTNTFDTENHVVYDEEECGIEVEVKRLDDIIKSSIALLKIDAEGYEYKILKGAKIILDKPDQFALIVEWNVDQNRYGVEEDKFLQYLTGEGYSAVKYEPYMRSLTPDYEYKSTGNILFVKDIAYCQRRVRKSKKYNIQGKMI